MDSDEIYQLLKSGSLKQQKSYFKKFRLETSASEVAKILKLNPGEFLSAFIPLVVQFCEFGNSDWGALAEATHRYAVEVYQSPNRSKISPRMLIDIAKIVIKGYYKQGREREVAEFGRRWGSFYRHLDKNFDLRSMMPTTSGRLPHSDAFVFDGSFGHFNSPHFGTDDIPGNGGSTDGAVPDSPGIDGIDDGAASDYLGVADSSKPVTPSQNVQDAEPDYPQVGPTSQTANAEPLEPTHRKSPPPVSTGFAHIKSPQLALDRDEAIRTDQRYYFWLEVAHVKGSIEAHPTPLPVDLIPASAKLTVVLFAPDSGIRVEPGTDVGEIQLQADGSATVLVQPVKKVSGAPEELLRRRLLFPVRTNSTPGVYRLRCSVYCHGVLIQSRIIQVKVGGRDRVSRVDYSLATRLDPEKLGTLTEHRFSMHINNGLANSHDFYFYGATEGDPYHRSVNINANKLNGLLQAARAALQRASWGDEGPWQATKPYRYDGKPNLEILRQDLAVLAIAGYRIFDELANQLADGKANVPMLRSLVSEPGLVQISADAEVGLVLPAALIYDYKLTLRIPPAKFKLCSIFERAFKDKTPLLQTDCFKGKCPSKEDDSTVCPSGFWGFRHALGLPFSNIEAGDENKNADFETRIEYSDVPVIIVGVSKAPDLPRTKTHTNELLALRPDWGQRPWLVRDSLDPLMYAMRSGQPHLVYIYCHGSGRPVGSAEIPMLYLGANPQAPQPGEWLERATLRDEIEWSHPRPLVFLNGCHTTKLDVDTILDFVTGFVQNANACGVVGTEITVFEPLAGAFATRFMKRFLGGQIVGQAIRDTRLDLLQEGNPLGLVYTPFALSGTQLVKVDKN